MVIDLGDRAVAANAGDGLRLSVHRIRGAARSRLRGRCGRARRRSSLGGRTRRRRRRSPARRTGAATRRTAMWSRSSTLLLDTARSARSATPPRRRRSSRSRFSSKPTCSKTLSIAAVVRQHLGDEPLDPDRGGAAGELLEQPRPDPAPLVGVSHRERRLRRSSDRGAERSSRSRRLAPRRLFGERADQRAALDPVRLEQRLDELWAQVRQSRGSGLCRLSARERAEEVEQRSRVCGAWAAAAASVPPSRRMTSTASIARLMGALSRSAGRV